MLGQAAQWLPAAVQLDVLQDASRASLRIHAMAGKQESTMVLFKF
jgi:hypothetical protein